MRAAPSRSSQLLDQLAITLGVPVKTFAAQTTFAPSNASVEQVAALLVDFDGWRLAVAFEALPPQFRRSLADIADALIASTASKDAA